MAIVRFKGYGETEVPVGSSILEAAQKIDAPEGYACGGVCACSTCHVYVTRGRELLSEQEEEEEDILDKAFDVRSNSRLGCQSEILRTARSRSRSHERALRPSRTNIRSIAASSRSAHSP